MVATSHQRGSFFRASQPCTPHRQPEQYARRHPDQTLFYRLIARHVETWLAERNLGDKPVAAYVEAELRGYLRCGILSFGFARARCGSCGHDFFVARRWATAKSRARDAASAPRVTADAWPRPPRAWLITSSHRCPSGSGSFPCRSGCGGFSVNGPQPSPRSHGSS